jgi:hypothetical protein
MPLIQPYSECAIYEQTYVQHENYSHKNVPYLNAEYDYVTSATEFVMGEQESLKDLIRVKEMHNESKHVFGNSSEHFVMSEYLKMRNAFVDMSFDEFHTDISHSDECLFIYGVKKNSKLFFNLFFEDNAVEALVNISTPGGKFVFDGKVEDCIMQMSKILN